MSATSNADLIVRAIQSNSLTRVKSLLDGGTVDINAKDSKGRTPLYVAAFLNRAKIVQLLLERGADTGIKYSNSNQEHNTPLLIASVEGYADCVRLLLKYKADIEAVNTNGDTALMLAAEHRNNDCVRLLLEHGANVHHRLYNGNTILIEAMEDTGDEEDDEDDDEDDNEDGSYITTVRLLLEHGAEVNAVGQQGEFALRQAAMHTSPACVKMLLDRGADPNMATVKGETALMMAASHDGGNTESVKLLLQHGANANAVDLENGRTALHWAMIGSTDIELVRLLLKHGADINLADKKGDTPLMYAASADRAEKDIGIIESVRLLLRQGADASRVNKDGKTALQLAQARGFKIIENILLNFENDGRPVLVEEVTRNAYKDLRVKPTATSEDIRKQYLRLRKELQKPSLPQKGTPTSLKSITASYNLLKTNRTEYDTVVDKPRRVLLSKLRKVCANQMDPVTLTAFQDMTLEELRRVYVIHPKNNDSVIATVGKPTCFSEDTLKGIHRMGRNAWKNPLTREPIAEALFEKIGAKTYKANAGDKAKANAGDKAKAKVNKPKPKAAGKAKANAGDKVKPKADKAKPNAKNATSRVS